MVVGHRSGLVIVVVVGLVDFGLTFGGGLVVVDLVVVGCLVVFIGLVWSSCC